MVKKLGTAKNDVFKGTSANDTYYGLAGDDTFYGRGGTDIIYAGKGDDKIDGGASFDVMYGGAGDDVFFVNHRRDDAIESAGQGTDKVYASISYRLEANVEKLTLTGTASINGSGNGLDNVIVGNSGKNAIYGAGGADTLKGGAGRDVFVFKAEADSPAAAGESDVIVDFKHGVDKIKLSAIDADLTTDGNAAFRFIGEALFTDNVAVPPSSFAEVSFSYNPDDDETLVLINIQKAAATIDTETGNTLSGDKIVDMQIVLRGEVTLTASDFIL